MTSKELKHQAFDILVTRCHRQQQQLLNIEPRLLFYFEDLIEHSSTDDDDDDDWHNVDELLGAIKFLRLLRTYPFNHDKVRSVIFDGEGEWQQEGRRWVHVRGGLKQPGRVAPMVYRWEPFQIFMLCAMYGPQAWIDTGNEQWERDLMPTERVNEQTGHIDDLRRLCVHFIAFLPRKTNKTGFSAITNCEDFMRGDNDAQIFCCANSQQQSRILYQRTVDLIRQLDPQGRRIRFTATECNWKPGQFRSASLYAMSAGGKTKDGTFASRCSPDEFGSAEYVNGKSDMGALVKVIESSMGPRREPMTVVTTTAGNIKTGPFMDMLLSTQLALRDEIDYDSGQKQPTLEGDRRMCLLLHPDEWELDEEVLLTHKNIRRKVNPMLGKIVQHSFYDSEIAAARYDPMTLREVISKLFNVYANSSISEWLKADEIRCIQVDRRIDDCTDDEGWAVFVGSDFSKGDDLNGNSYLAVRWNEQQGEMEFFGDMDSYMSEQAVNESPLRELFRTWAADGWLHIVPGKTFDPVIATNRVIELHQKGINFMSFGYDPYNSKTVINALSQWVFDLGLQPTDIIKPVRQNFATYNPAVVDFELMVRRAFQQPDGTMQPAPQIHLSRNPMWPWQFSNCVLQESSDGMGNCKPVKGNASCKVDNVQMLLTALIGYNMKEGEVSN